MGYERRQSNKQKSVIPWAKVLFYVCHCIMQVKAFDKWPTNKQSKTVEVFKQTTATIKFASHLPAKKSHICFWSYLASCFYKRPIVRLQGSLNDWQSIQRGRATRILRGGSRVVQKTRSRFWRSEIFLRTTNFFRRNPAEFLDPRRGFQSPPRVGLENLECPHSKPPLFVGRGSMLDPTGGRCPGCLLHLCYHYVF